MEKILKHYAKLKAPSTKSQMLYAPIYMKCPQQGSPYEPKVD